MKSPKKIYIIDDEETIANLLKTVLSIYGYECATSSLPRQAVEEVQSNPPDLVILDIAMPDMDGYEVCKILKNNKATAHIPILFITALSLIQDKRQAMECGADGFIFKPFDPQNIVEEIARLLSDRATT